MVHQDRAVVIFMPLTLTFQGPYLFAHLRSNCSILLQTLHFKAEILQMRMDLLNPHIQVLHQFFCSPIAISKPSAWVVIFYCESATLRCGKSEATNHSRFCPCVKFILALWILHFNLWSHSKGVSPGFKVISLNPTIDCTSDLGLLNSLFSTVWISANLAFGLSLD